MAERMTEGLESEGVVEWKPWQARKACDKVHKKRPAITGRLTVQGVRHSHCVRVVC